MEITGNFVKKVICYDEVDSTNNAAKDYHCTQPTLFVAKNQTAGRGRQGKIWESQKDAGIYMSLALMPEIGMDKVMQITLVSALAVCEALNGLYGTEAVIKWPNDIVLGGKKVCGILTEALVEKGIVKKVVTGIGINVSNTSFPDEISHIATSLYMHTNKRIKKQDIVNSILDRFEVYYNMLMHEGRLDKIIARYKTLCVNIGRRVTFVYKNQSVEAMATDISPVGELVAVKDDGNVITVNAGEVSVKGIYGCL